VILILITLRRYLPNFSTLQLPFFFVIKKHLWRDSLKIHLNTCFLTKFWPTRLTIHWWFLLESITTTRVACYSLSVNVLQRPMYLGLSPRWWFWEVLWTYTQEVRHYWGSLGCWRHALEGNFGTSVSRSLCFLPDQVSDLLWHVLPATWHPHQRVRAMTHSLNLEQGSPEL
jgi:hypothetical protein